MTEFKQDETLRLKMNEKLMREYLLHVLCELLTYGIDSTCSLNDLVLWVDKIERKED